MLQFHTLCILGMLRCDERLDGLSKKMKLNVFFNLTRLGIDVELQKEVKLLIDIYL